MEKNERTNGVAPTGPIPEAVSFSRELSGVFNGEPVDYRAVAGETYIRDEKGSPVGSFFTVAYVRPATTDAAQRPVAFIFNGGPGSSAQWLHMGALGPRRVLVPQEPDNIGAPPYPIIDNPQSVLDSCDLVFVDPIGTGYSRALGEKENKDYWGVLEDARSVADFVQAWITENGRWNAPKYLIGESYATTRVSVVAEILSTRYVAINGIVLISTVLDYQNSRPSPGDGAILAYASFLPTYAAIAAYHGKVDLGGRTTAAFLDEVRLFARTEYATALIANSRLRPGERAAIVAKVAAVTGLSESYVDRSELRIPVKRFFKELLRDRGLVIGRLDGRYVGVEPESAGEAAEGDPSFDAIGSAFSAAMNQELCELGVRMDREYMPIRTIDAWNWLIEPKTPNGGGYVNVIPHLGRAMRRNKDLRVLVASGYYDLATPFLGAENALSQDGLVHERITFTYYEVGHMIFLHEPSRVRLLNEVRSLITGVGPEAPKSASRPILVG